MHYHWLAGIENTDIILIIPVPNGIALCPARTVVVLQAVQLTVIGILWLSGIGCRPFCYLLATGQEGWETQELNISLMPLLYHCIHVAIIWDPALLA